MDNPHWSYDDVIALCKDLEGTIKVDGDDHAQRQIKIAICGSNASAPFCLDVKREDGYKVWAHIDVKSPHVYEISRHGQRAGYAASTVSPTEEMTQNDARVSLLSMLLNPSEFLGGE